MTWAASDLAWVTLTWWAVSLSGVLMPGPVSAMAVSEGSRRGTAAGPLLTGGHAVAETVLVGLLALGLGRVLGHPAVVGAIGVVGGIVLLWMGWGTLMTARSDLPPVSSPTDPPAPKAGLVRTGALATAGNPYWLLWWATVGASYFIAFTRFGLVAILVLFLAGHLALDLGWNSLLASLAGSGRLLFPARAYRAVLGSCGVFVMALSVYFCYSGVRLLGTIVR